MHDSTLHETPDEETEPVEEQPTEHHVGYLNLSGDGKVN